MHISRGMKDERPRLALRHLHPIASVRGRSRHPVHPYYYYYCYYYYYYYYYY